MAAHKCPKCGKLRKIDIMASRDGWNQPECYHCGDPGYFEPFNTEVAKCPICGGPATKEEPENTVYCANSSCNFMGILPDEVSQE